APQHVVCLHARKLVARDASTKAAVHHTLPEICVLDPDGDILRYLRARGHADRHPDWACYHTDLYVFRREVHEYGIVGCAVGAAFAVHADAQRAKLAHEALAAAGIPVQVGATWTTDAPFRETKEASTTCRGGLPPPEALSPIYPGVQPWLQ